MAPTVIHAGSLRIEVRTKEKNHLKIPHCHAVAPGAEASIGLEPVKVLASSGFNQPTLNRIVEMVRARREELLAKWKEIHGGEEEEKN